MTTWNAYAASDTAANLASETIPANALARDTDTNGLWVGTGGTGGSYFAPAVTPASRGISAGSTDQTSALQALLDSGAGTIDLEGLSYTAGALTVSTAGQRITNGTLVLTTGLTIAADNVQITSVRFYQNTNQSVIVSSGKIGVRIISNLFDQTSTGWTDTSQSSLNYSAVHVQSGAKAIIADNVFHDSRGPQVIRIDGYDADCTVSGNLCNLTVGRFVAVGTPSGTPASTNNRVSVIGNNVYGVGVNYTGSVTLPAGIYCNAGNDQPGSVVIGNTIENCLENAIEGPWGVIAGNSIKNVGTFKNTSDYLSNSRNGISTFNNSIVSGNRIDMCGIRGINLTANNSEPLGNMVVTGNLISNSGVSSLVGGGSPGHYDIYLSSQSNGSVPFVVEGNVCESADGILLSVGAASELASAKIANNTGVLATKVAGVAAVSRTSRLLQCALPDNVATSVCRITAPNEGGGYSVFVKGMIANNVTTNASNDAAKAFQASFARVTRSDGTGVTGTVSYAETASAATANSARDVGTVVVTTTEYSEQAIDIQIQADGIGSSGAAMACFLEIEIISRTSTCPLIADVS